jgi:hypothetical protein
MIFRKLKSKKKIIILIILPITLYMMFFFDFEPKFYNKFDKICFKNYNQKKNLTLLTPDKNTSIHLNAYKVDLSYYNGSSTFELFPLLKRSNAILLDIEILKNINVLSFLDGLKRVSNFQKRSSLITFGIHPDSFHQLNEVIA